jgi:hypothetical protein
VEASIDRVGSCDACAGETVALEPVEVGHGEHGSALVQLRHGGAVVATVAEHPDAERVRVAVIVEAAAFDLGAACGTLQAIRHRAIALGHRQVELHSVDALVPEQAAGVVHMNAGHAYAEGLVRMQQLRDREPGFRAPAGVHGPYQRVDATTAHEIGHLLDRVYQARARRDMIEVRRGVGECLGVETLEYALRRSSDPARQRAHERLVAEVSAYATTNINEAYAELFEAWWLGGPATPPVVRRFGALMDEYFPE